MATTDIQLSSEEVFAFYEKYFKYFNTLSSPYKNLFVDRALLFIQSKNFVGLKNTGVNNKVKAIISASAIQLTLGLEIWQMNYFHTIFVFPSDFKNAITGLSLKGEANLSGFVSFSFSSFIEGYRISNDNLNLGLHEFTHALRFNGVKGDKTDVFFDNYFEKWFCHANDEYIKVKKGNKSIFRQYGGTNINEFLSVVVEHFFESPNKLKNSCPDLFLATGILLNQINHAGVTYVGVREVLLKRQSSGHSLSNLMPKQAFFRLPGVISSYVLILISLITFLRAGPLSFPALFMLILSLLLVLRNDFYYARFKIEANQVVINYGYFLFKNRKIISVFPNKLIKVNFNHIGGNDETVSFEYLDAEGFFTEAESHVNLNPNDKALLINELKKSFVWVRSH